ncbi:MAG: energy transducer TonB [Colwellia sp.]|nr:energy transducer TonB [Colwellia sp.]
MTKLISTISLAIIITFGLFAFMAALISSDTVNITKVLPPIIVEIASIPADSKVDVMEKVKLDPPPAPEPMPITIVTPDSPGNAIGLAYQVPSVVFNKGSTGLGENKSINDNEARPIFRVTPKYPIDAMRKGIQGWVKLAFDINEIGKVVNITITDSKPKRIFDKAARKALRKWKYQAKSVDGKSVFQKNRTVQLDFTIEEQS